MIRAAVRSLLRQSSFTLGVAGTLAIGIAASNPAAVDMLTVERRPSRSPI